MTSPTLKVSVVIALYNQSSKISDAVASVLEQTYQNWELIIVDDGSEDTSLQRARLVARYDPRIKVAARPHSSANETRRIGFNLASDDSIYLAFLNSYDVWSRDALERLMSRLSANPDAVAITGQGGTKVHARETSHAIDDVLTIDSLFDGDTPAPASSALMRRWAYEACGGYAPEMRADGTRDLWTRLCLYGRFLRIDANISPTLPQTDHPKEQYRNRIRSYRRAYLNTTLKTMLLLIADATAEMADFLEHAGAEGVFPTIVGLGCGITEPDDQLRHQIAAMETLHENHFVVCCDSASIRLDGGLNRLFERYAAFENKLVFACASSERGDLCLDHRVSAGRAGIYCRLFQRYFHEYQAAPHNDDYSFFAWVHRKELRSIEIDAVRRIFTNGCQSLAK